MEESSTSTTSTSAVTVGTSVAIAVSSESGFTTNDWVEIYGIDGLREVAKVTGTGANEITVDQLVFGHVTASVVVLLQTPEYVKRFLEIESAIAVAIYAVGNTYTFNASYNILGQISVVKGVPHTHWRESIAANRKERDVYKTRLRIRPAIVT